MTRYAFSPGLPMIDEDFYVDAEIDFDNSGEPVLVVNGVYGCERGGVCLEQSHSPYDYLRAIAEAVTFKAEASDDLLTRVMEGEGAAYVGRGPGDPEATYRRMG